VKAAGVRGSFWPSPTQEELIRVAIGPSDRAADVWRRLRSEIDLQTLEDGSFALMPLLYERLEAVVPDEPELSLLKGIYRSTWYKSRLFLDRLDSLVAALGERGIGAIVVGGAAASRRWYSKPGSRPIGLLEVVVAPADAERTRGAATASGWRPAGREPGHRRYVDEVGRVLVVYEGVPAPVAGPLGPTDAWTAMLSESEQRSDGMRVLSARDELLFVCGLSARTTSFPSVQWLLDADRIIGAATASADAVARARLFHLVEALRDTVAYLARVSGNEAVKGFSEQLAGEPASRRDALAYKLGGARVGRLGGLPLTVASHLRANAEAPLWRAAATLPDGVARSWEADGVAGLPASALRKLRAQRKRSASS
jgi:hypothetical protein